LLVAAASMAGLAGIGPARANWVGSWSADTATLAHTGVSGKTVREYASLSLGGTQLRVRFSNETGTDDLRIGAAHLSLPGSAPGSIDPASDHVLTFGGAATVSVPPGAPILSDPVDFPVSALSTVAVTALFDSGSAVQVGHLTGDETAYLLAGDHTGDTALGGATTTTTRFYLDGIDVEAPGQTRGAVGTVGDSITDGLNSTPDRDRRWTDRLAERFATRLGGPAHAVLNGGITGNALLSGRLLGLTGPSALARLDRDVLARSGLHWLVLFEGINDIIFSSGATTAADLIAADRQIIARTHDRGIAVMGATLTPFLGTGPGSYSLDKERMRQAVNRWIRTSGEFDATVDFDAVLRDPAHPNALRPGYDSGDHLHPNDAGYRAMGDAFSLETFR